MTQQRKKCGKGGFTLVELVVTLVILSILFAIAVPSLLGYIHLSQFRKNESYAKTMYLSAESELTYLRTGGEWESFCSKVKKEGVLNQSFDESDEDRKKLVGRIYGIRLDAGEYAEGELSGDGALVGALLSQDTYDKSVLNAAICIEIDVESGQVYSVSTAQTARDCTTDRMRTANRRICPAAGWILITASATAIRAGKNGWAITRFRMQSMLSVWMRPS